MPIEIIQHPPAHPAFKAYHLETEVCVRELHTCGHLLSSLDLGRFIFKCITYIQAYIT